MSEPASSAALHVAGLSKQFGKLTALADVSLTVPQGICFGLLGPNGAGKTTLIRCVIGRVRPDGGAVTLFGTQAGSRAASALVGWVPQDLALYLHLSVRENLYVFGRYQGLSGKPLEDAIAWALEWSDLADRAGTVAAKLSGGMKRRLNLAAGVLHRPKLVLLDEPTVGVDPQSRNRIFDMVAELRQAGATIVYTTHYMEEAERLCDSIAIIDHGNVIAQGSREDLVATAFGERYDVQIRLTADGATWAAAQGGTYENDTASFAIARPADIVVLLESAERDGLEIADVVLRRPNLESVFLHLTGRELRE